MHQQSINESYSTVLVVNFWQPFHQSLPGEPKHPRSQEQRQCFKCGFQVYILKSHLCHSCELYKYSLHLILVFSLSVIEFVGGSNGSCEQKRDKRLWSGLQNFLSPGQIDLAFLLQTFIKKNFNVSQKFLFISFYPVKSVFNYSQFFLQNMS